MAVQDWPRQLFRFGWLPVLAALLFSACNLPLQNSLPGSSVELTPSNVGPSVTEELLPLTSTLSPTDTPEATPTGLPLEPVGVAETVAVSTEPSFSQTPETTPTNTPVVCFTLLAPADESGLSGAGKVTFEWQPMPGATRYELLFLLPNGRMETYTTTEVTYARSLESLPLTGLYRWQVTAFDSTGGRMCVVGMFRFTRPAVAPTPKPPKDEDPSDPIDLFDFWTDDFFAW